MENKLKETFDKIEMDTDRKDTIREAIHSKRSKNYLWIRAAACIAACMILLFCIPTTREFIVRAATDLMKVFYAADGNEVTYIEATDETQFVVAYDEHKSYAKVENGRLYFTFKNEMIDITDECSDTRYYRYEISNPEGTKSVIFVGGTIDDYGWVELLFDEDGNYIFNQMQVKEINGWVNLAMHNEGVPCGDPSLDDLLEK